MSFKVINSAQFSWTKNPSQDVELSCLFGDEDGREHAVKLIDSNAFSVKWLKLDPYHLLTAVVESNVHAIFERSSLMRRLFGNERSD